MAECERCKKPIDDWATRCPYCTTEFEHPPAYGTSGSSHEGPLWTLLICPPLGLVVGVVGGASYGGFLGGLFFGFVGLCLGAALGNELYENLD
jgi:hypothetical protein